MFAGAQPRHSGRDRCDRHARVGDSRRREDDRASQPLLDVPARKQLERVARYERGRALRGLRVRREQPRAGRRERLH